MNKKRHFLLNILSIIIINMFIFVGFYFYKNSVLAQDKIETKEDIFYDVIMAQELFSSDTKSSLMSEGINAYKRGEYEKALDKFNKVVEINTDYYDAWIGIGNSLFNLGRFDDAISAFSKATQIDPDKFEAWNNKGLLSLRLRKYPEAIEAFSHAIKIKPDSHEVCYNIGLVLSELGKVNDAIGAFDKALAV